MKRLNLIFVRIPFLAVILAGASSRGATVLFDQNPVIYSTESSRGINWHSQGGVPLSDTVGNPSGSDGRAPVGETPTPHQFTGVIVYGSVSVQGGTTLGAGAGSSLQANAQAEFLNWPRLENPDGTVKLVLRSQVGAPNMQRFAAFYFGSVIPRPKVDETGNPLTEAQQRSYWAAEPYTTDNHANKGYYWSPHAEKVYAVQPGRVEITWRTQRGIPDAEKNPEVSYTGIGGLNYALLSEFHIVSGATVKKPRKIYWTEGRYHETGKAVSVPPARVGDIKIVYNSAFPEFVGRGDAILDEGSESFVTNRTDRTLWYDATTTKQILARNKEGRVFVEILGDVRGAGPNRNQLGFEIVDVIERPSPVDVTIELGEEVTPPPGSSESELFPEPILVGPLGTFAFQHFVDGSNRIQLFATRETKNLNDYQVHWMEDGVAGLRWPTVLARYSLVWPDDPAKYSHYIRSESNRAEAQLTAIPLPTSNVPVIEYQDLDPDGNPRAALTQDFRFFTYLDSNFQAHRTLLRFTSGDNIAFERVLSVLENVITTGSFAGDEKNPLGPNLSDALFSPDVDDLNKPRFVESAVSVGQRLTPPLGEASAASGLPYLAGYVYQPAGTGFSVTAYVNPFEAGFDQAAQGSIIPVNTGPSNSAKLEVWWYRRNRQSLAQGFQPIFWPSVIGSYSIQWPEGALEIILASNKGSGGLASLQAKGTVYVQNDPAKPGYNPNEEHALILSGQVYALRDDLNITTAEGYSSDPYVLLEYTDTDGRPSMSVFQVLREKPEEGILFDYVVDAGMPLQAPMPLPLLPKPTEGSGDNTVNYNVEPDAVSGDLPANWSSPDETGPYGHYRKFTYQDRKNEFWVYRGVHAGLPSLAMGTFNSTSKAIEAFQAATAVVGTPFAYAVHTSRRIPSLVLSADSSHPMPSWLSISGLTIKGTPASGDVGTTSINLVLKDVRDDNQVAATLQVTVSATGSQVTQAPLEITSFNSFANADVTYVGRPPYLAESPNGQNSFTMRFYYRTREGFAWPGIANPPPVDSIVPYLRPVDSNGDFVGNGASKATDSLDIVYRPAWPTSVKRLFLGDTLMDPKLGLPQVRGQTSLQILYQQSIARDIDVANASAILHDPTREKFVNIADHGLAILPPSVRAERYQGKLFFPNLPPHLVDRFFFDPNRSEAGQLVLRGEFKDEPVGEKYVQLNVLRGSDLQAVKDLTPVSDTQNKAKWDSVINALATTLETFHENPDVPKTYIPDPDLDASIGVEDLAEIQSANTAVDSYALSASGPGQGFITLIAGNGTAFTPEGDPVSVYVLRVTGPLVTGELKVLPSPNPLSELLTVYHTSDMAGRFDEFEYEWKIAPPVDGFPPLVDEALSDWTLLASGNGIPFFTLGGAGIQALIDNYLIMRYRPINPAHPLFNQWSDWTDPQLAEGWIKRVLAGINPFNQRVTDLFSNRVNTDVSILTQAGPRWEGDVALNLETINDRGLIEIYETVLRRGKMLSIESGINFGPANDALLLAAGYLNDLYMMMGNEAWADAANPTIGIGTQDRTYGEIATSLFSFKGQMASLLEEELALLRGRDDFLQPGVEIRPVYNRLFWNYTRGIDSGEVIYALNYNIQEDNDAGFDGVINADDARKMFPQGHGDAYGHYLTAVKGYYSLLLDTDFDWVPRIEAVTVLGKAVSVDYQDERKFAAAAAAVARAGRQVFDLTWRKDYFPGEDAGWEHFSDTRSNTRRSVPTTRYWGADHWASRTGEGAYLNWALGNSILPDVDPDPAHEGIQKVDRTMVPELMELVATADALQTALDNAEGRLTPLGMADGSLAFDIDPTQVTGPNSETHFEQVYKRAKLALGNAFAAFDDAKDVTQLMRSEQDSMVELQTAVDNQEFAYTTTLIELYGTPYSDDIGPGKTYKQGYSGPDIVHYMYVETPDASFMDLVKQPEANSFRIDIQDLPDNWGNRLYTDFDFNIKADAEEYELGQQYIEFELGPHGFVGKPASWSGKRKSPGQIQQAISGLIRAHNALAQTLSDAEGAKGDLDLAINLFQAKVNTYGANRAAEAGKLALEETVQAAQFAFDVYEKQQETIDELAKEYHAALMEAFPRSLIAGLAAGGDLTAPARAASRAVRGLEKSVFEWSSIALFITVEALKASTETINRQVDFNFIQVNEWDQELREEVVQLGDTLEEIQDYFIAIVEQLRSLDDAQRNLDALIADGERIQLERETFRQRSAALVQGFRTRDAAFRIFRNEKLERYKTLFDLAARYAFLAANAYDYETGLLNTQQGKEFINRIVNSRALGVMRDGEPQFAGSNTGDPGLSSVLAEMKADFDVLKGRLGFNNPNSYGTTVSLRMEDKRIIPAADGDAAWQDVLERGRRANLLEDSDISRYCMQIDPGNGLPVPGIVLEFGTAIEHGANLFGQVLAGGDHKFDISLFATKIFSVGVAFEGYIGMDNPVANTSAITAAGGYSPPDPSATFLGSKSLSANPGIYLIPVGVDSMRSPPLGDASEIRSWRVDDVAIPLPFNIGGSALSTKALWQSNASLTEPLFSVRKHAAFRPVSATAAFGNDIYFGTNLRLSQFTNNRLIGRSIWNTKWKLVIPGHNLLGNPNEGLDRFIQTVKDVKLHFVTYSYAGN